jgi:hypothetical protein
MSLHPHDDQVDIDNLSTALACIVLHRDLAPGAAGNPLSEDVRHAQAVGAARLLWQSEGDRALMRAERGRCFDL